METTHRIFREFDISVSPKSVKLLNGFEFNSRSLAAHLKGCVKCVVFAATLGHETDAELRRLQFIDMSAALNFDKKANKDIELICDGIQAEIEKTAQNRGFYITGRFSPGYGDFGLENQSLILSLLDAQKRLGMTLTESNLLIPQKSVTAVIGYASVPAEKNIKPCKICVSREKCKERIKK